MSRVEDSLEPVPVEWLVRADGFVPKARYTSAAFADLELQRLWSRVWQVAAREEELAQPGDYVEYTIGDESVLVVRAADGTIGAFHNSCRHRGTRLAADAGAFADGCIQCPYHGWQYGLDGALVRVVDAEEFTNLPDGLALRSVRVDCFGGFVFVNLDRDAEPLLEFLDPLPTLLAPYHPSACGCGPIARRSSTRTGRPSSTRSTRATTCKVCTRRSFRGPTT
jgi:phenylpropionate dioxygenase-like ring-hydroxylating dioxygenase large terminal subunit